MPFEQFTPTHQSQVARSLRQLARAIEEGRVVHSYDIAGDHPSQPDLVELTLYMRDNHDSRS